MFKKFLLINVVAVCVLNRQFCGFDGARATGQSLGILLPEHSLLEGCVYIYMYKYVSHDVFRALRKTNLVDKTSLSGAASYCHKCYYCKLPCGWLLGNTKRLWKCWGGGGFHSNPLICAGFSLCLYCFLFA